MPGTEGTSDEIDGLLADLNAGDADQSADLQHGAAGVENVAHDAPPAATEQKLLAGRYKTAQDLEKAHLSLRKGYDQHATKAKTLEALIRNPIVQHLAQTDPTVRAALAKAGIELAQAQAEEGGDADDGDEVDEDDPRFQVMVLRQEIAFKEQYADLVRELGRPLQPEEHKAVVEKLKAIRDLTVADAWRLTPQYAKALKEREEKAVAAAVSRLQPKRPAPHPAMLPGQKLDMKKPVTQMNEQEAAAKLADIIERNP